MPGNSIFFRFVLVVFLFTAGLSFSADNRYALVIGNGNYRDRSIASLANPVNDATDVAASLKSIGYNVTLKTNIGLRDMISAVRDFTVLLRRAPENEGFFWFAGHGLSIRGIHYMLPVDIDPVDDNIIARGAYSVDDLMEEIENSRNRTNLIVIDACRNTLLPGASGSRSTGSRGLAVLSRDDYRIKGNKIVYSTMAGRTASDGASGSRNSPFAQAFLSHIQSPEIFDDVFLDIANETLRLTKGDQEPYTMGAFAVKSYSLNPQAIVQPAQTAQARPVETTATPETSVETTRVNPNTPSASSASERFLLDGKKVISLSVAPIFYGSTFSGKGFGFASAFTFYEKYRNYGEMFFLPNSFFASLDFGYDTHVIKPTLNIDTTLQNIGILPPGYSSGISLSDGEQEFAGGIMGVGALWKIRMGESQRFIANFGLSLEFFVGASEFYYEDGGTREKLSELDNSFDPGFGLHGGISFRFSRLVSLDFGLKWKYAFMGKDITVAIYHPYTNAYLYDEYFAKGIHPYTFGGNLGVSFWWPK